jgi:hypothetical protein
MIVASFSLKKIDISPGILQTNLHENEAYKIDMLKSRGVKGLILPL